LIGRLLGSTIIRPRRRLLRHAWLAAAASLPLFQMAGCSDAVASAIAAEVTTQISTPLFLSVETVLLNVLEQ
jgi:hypothetical protein